MRLFTEFYTKESFCDRISTFWSINLRTKLIFGLIFLTITKVSSRYSGIGQIPLFRYFGNSRRMADFPLFVFWYLDLQLYLFWSKKNCLHFVYVAKHKQPGTLSKRCLTVIKIWSKQVIKVTSNGTRQSTLA